jgi:16S rRNA (guanine1207-N2)-methyltransferase
MEWQATGAMSHYFSPSPDLHHDERTVRLTIPGLTCDLATDAGVFSGDRIDPGTKYLLTEAPAPIGPVCVDLGCGYGPIARTLVHRAPEAAVYAVDVNERARALTARNVPDAVVIAPDNWPGGICCRRG